VEITKKELERAFSDYGAEFGGQLEDYFALLYLKKEFTAPPEAAHRQVAFGGNDYGVDAFYIDKDRRNLYLYQFKWSADHRLFKNSFERLISKGMERIFGNPLQDPTQNQLLLQLKSKLFENKALIDRVLIRFVFNGDPSAAEQSAVLDSLREDLESKKYLVDKYFERQVELAFQFISNETEKLAGLAHTKKTHEYCIDLSKTVSFETQKAEKMCIGFVSLMDLYGMYREMGNRFFERNIRGGLSPDKPPNRAMRRALKSIVLDEEELPENFTFAHNGMTLAAERFEHKESGQVVITEPRLLNGAQTITSISKFLKDNEGNPGLEKNEQLLKSIRVLVKVIWNAPPDFIVNVTVGNNKQNPVAAWNLRANDRIQLELQDKFATDAQVYYERQEGVFDNMSDDDLERLGVDPNQGKQVQITKLAQTFLAIQGEIDKMSRMPEVFENQKIYQETFRSSYLHADTRKILLAYKIQFRLNKIIDEILAKGEVKYLFIRRARNLVWALLVQGILNDEDLPALCGRFGIQLVAEADFTSYLKKMATTRVRFIIGEAVGDNRSQEMIADEKYDFLRTKAIFQRCMEVAYKRHKWKKRSI
jgi:hypothetical protein